MNSKVRKLEIARAVDCAEQAETSIVADLEWLLREAKAGRLRAVAFAFKRINDAGKKVGSTGWSGGDDVTVGELIGEVAILNARMIQSCVQDLGPSRGAPDRGDAA